MKQTLTITILLLLLCSEKAASQYTSDSLNQSIKSLLQLRTIDDVEINLPRSPKSWLMVTRNNQRLQKNSKSYAKRRKRVLSLTHDIGVLAKISKTSSMSFYSAVFAAPTSTFMPIDGTDFFSDIQATTPEDDADMRFGYSKLGKKIDLGISLYSKQVELSDESLIELDDDLDNELEFDDDLNENDLDENDDESAYRQGIRFNTTYHLVQTQNQLLNIDVELVVIQNNSASAENIDGFDEDDLPSKTIRAGLNYQLKRFKFGFDSKFISSTTAFANHASQRESIKIFNSSIGFEFSEKATISLECHNILNENRLSKGGYAVLRNPKLILNQARYFLLTYTLNF